MGAVVPPGGDLLGRSAGKRNAGPVVERCRGSGAAELERHDLFAVAQVEVGVGEGRRGPAAAGEGLGAREDLQALRRKPCQIEGTVAFEDECEFSGSDEGAVTPGDFARIEVNRDEVARPLEAASSARARAAPLAASSPRGRDQGR